MTITFPEGVEGEGNLKVAFLPAIADVDEPSLAGDFGGAEIEVSCYLVGDGVSNHGGSQETRTDRRLCSRQVFESPGSITYTVGEITYVYDPQDPEDAGGENEAYAELSVDRVGFLVLRWGVPYEDDYAIGDIIDIFPVILGAQFKNPPVIGAGAGGGGTSKLTVRQTPYISGPATLDTAIVA